MYKTPIEVIMDEIQIQQEGEIYKAVQNIGINVDKEELLKALEYDRCQYSVGYEDGFGADKWKNAEYMLPEEGERVLVCCKTKKGVRSINLAYQTNGVWHGNGSMSGVTHWQNLPELPGEN